MFELGWNIATKLAELTDQLHAISISHMHATGLTYTLSSSSFQRGTVRLWDLGVMFVVFLWILNTTYPFES